MDLFTIGNIAADWAGKEGLKTNTSFSSTMGGSTSFLVGSANSHAFGSALKTSTDFNQLLRLIYNPVLSPILDLGFSLVFGGGESAYTLGNKTSITYRTSPNFTLDRLYKGLGILGSTNVPLTEEDEKKINDVTIKDKPQWFNWLFPTLCSTVLVAWDMVLVYHFDISRATNGVVTDSINPEAGAKLSEDRNNAGTADEREGRGVKFYATGDELLTYLGYFQGLVVPTIKFFDTLVYTGDFTKMCAEYWGKFTAKLTSGLAMLGKAITGLLSLVVTTLSSLFEVAWKRTVVFFNDLGTQLKHLLEGLYDVFVSVENFISLLILGLGSAWTVTASDS